METRSKAAKRRKFLETSPHYEAEDQFASSSKTSRIHACIVEELSGIWKDESTVSEAEKILTDDFYYRGGTRRSLEEQNNLLEEKPNSILYLAPDFKVAKIYAELGKTKNNKRGLFRFKFNVPDKTLLNVSKRKVVVEMLGWAKGEKTRSEYAELARCTFVAYGVEIDKKAAARPYDIKKHAEVTKLAHKEQEVIIADEIERTLKAIEAYSPPTKDATIEPLANARMKDAIKYSREGYCVRNSIDTLDKVVHEAMLEWVAATKSNCVGIYSAPLPSLCTLEKFNFWEGHEGGFHAEVVTKNENVVADDAGTYGPSLDYTQKPSSYCFGHYQCRQPW